MAATWTQPLGNALFATGKLTTTQGMGDVAAFNEAYNMYAAANPAKAALLTQGVDPDTSEDICGPRYGCGATIAHKPAKRSPDPAAAVAGALALLAGLFVMRRRRR